MEKDIWKIEYIMTVGKHRGQRHATHVTAKDIDEALAKFREKAEVEPDWVANVFSVHCVGTLM